MQSLLDYLAQTTALHLVYAFIIGLMVAFNPCQIAICLSAIFVKDDKNNLENKEKWIGLFALGRAAMYFILGTAVFFLFIFSGNSIEELYNKKFTDIIDKIIPYAALAFGLFFLVRAVFKHHHQDNCHNSKTIIKKNKAFGPFILGAVLALVFCPESALLFFAFLMPLTVSSAIGLLNLVVFACAAVTPIVILAKLYGASDDLAKRMEYRMEKIQFFINLSAAIILLTIGIVLFFT